MFKGIVVIGGGVIMGKKKSIDELLDGFEYERYDGKSRGSIQMTEDTIKQLVSIKESIIIKGKTSVLIPFELVKEQFGHNYKYLHSYTWQLNKKLKQIRIGLKVGEKTKRQPGDVGKRKYVRFYLFDEWNGGDGK